MTEWQQRSDGERGVRQKQKRRSEGISRDVLAAEMNIKVQTLQDYENGLLPFTARFRTKYNAAIWRILERLDDERFNSL